MTESTSTYRWQGLALASYLIAVLVGGVSTCRLSSPDATVLELVESRSADASPPHLYGLTEVDAAHLADLARSSSRSVHIASFPGRRALNGPLVTRTSHLGRHLSAPMADSISRTSIGGGWSRLQASSEGESPLAVHTPRPRLAEARVATRDTEGRRSPCLRVGLERFQCDTPRWAFTGRHRAQIEGRQQSCIWSHPLEGRTTVVTYPSVPPAPPERTYHLQTALDDRAVDTPGVVEIEMRVGERLLHHRHPSQQGWRSIQLPDFDQPTRVILEISAERTGRRHFCYRFRTR